MSATLRRSGAGRFSKTAHLQNTLARMGKKRSMPVQEPGCWQAGRGGRSVRSMVSGSQPRDDAPALQAVVIAALSAIVRRRRARGFDEREVALLKLLRSTIDAALERTTAAERAARAGLTRRELQVLDRVAAGDSNLLVAQRLGVRPRTVDKHLEHAYAKLRVSSRTAAVARLRGIAH